MQPGQILVADHGGVYIIKLVGDVRLTLCVSFDSFIDTMFSRDDFCSILFDLSEAEAVDSTTLGLMAKISIFAQQRRQVVPIVYSTNPGIDRLLFSMGFNEIFEIVHEMDAPAVAPLPLSGGNADETAVKSRVLEAHRILMDLNDGNRETFQDLVKTLEDS